jgi:glycine/sarcosine N-methyltransferase
VILAARDFYDQLAGEYDLIFEDWSDSIARQGRLLDALIRSRVTVKGATLLDCACGIGTQALGLAALGWNVVATDLSPLAVDRAAREARARALALETHVADMRELGPAVDRHFEVVIACDNAIAHLTVEDDLRRALLSMRERLLPGGLLLMTTRDYDTLAIEKPALLSRHAIRSEAGWRLVLQVCDWSPDGGSYIGTHLLVRQDDPEWKTIHRATRFRAWKREEVTRLLQASRFVDACWHDPAATEFYQPILTARAV